MTYINGELLSFTVWSSCTGNDVTKSPFSINAPKSDWSNVIWKHQSYALLTLCDGNLKVTGGFPSQRISHTESDFMSWRHHSICFIFRVWVPHLSRFQASMAHRHWSNGNWNWPGRGCDKFLSKPHPDKLKSRRQRYHYSDTTWATWRLESLVLDFVSTVYLG